MLGNHAIILIIMPTSKNQQRLVNVKTKREAILFGYWVLAVCAILIALAWTYYSGSFFFYHIDKNSGDNLSQAVMTWIPATELPTQGTGYYDPNIPEYWIENGYVTCDQQGVIEGSDPDTFMAASTSDYGKDKNHAYSCLRGVIPEAKPSSFIALSRDYAKDSGNVYLFGNVLHGTDPATFQVLGQNPSHPDERVFSKDKNNVYFGGNILLAADPETFTINDGYAHDINWEYTSSVTPGRSESVAAKAYTATLPYDCHQDTAWDPGTRPFPSFFSMDGEVVGWSGHDLVCIANMKTAKTYSYSSDALAIESGGFDELVYISRDGSKLYYFNRLIGKGIGDSLSSSPCSECGWYSTDVTTGNRKKLTQLTQDEVVYLSGGSISWNTLIFWNDHFGPTVNGGGDDSLLDVNAEKNLVANTRRTGGRVVLEVRKPHDTNWDYLTIDAWLSSSIVQSLHIPQKGFYSDLKISQDGRFVDYLYIVNRVVNETDDILDWGTTQRGRLNIATGENIFLN